MNVCMAPQPRTCPVAPCERKASISGGFLLPPNQRPRVYPDETRRRYHFYAYTIQPVGKFLLGFFVEHLKKNVYMREVT